MITNEDPIKHANPVERLAQLGMAAPLVSIPAKNISLDKWACIACDQYSQDRDYWQRVEDYVGDSPSTLKIILPEAYLSDDDRDKRVRKIHETMNAYAKTMYDDASRILLPPSRGAMFVERDTNHGTRRGLLMACDLEKYDWHCGSKTIIRASEETVASRLPPRAAVRTGASLECPHVMLLLDDVGDLLFRLIDKISRGSPYAYDGDLMFNSGHVRGRFLNRQNDWNFLADVFEYILRKTRTVHDSGMLFAVGDGNHSLATAKEVWERYKAEHTDEKGLEKHPARWALVEIVNLHDESLVFEPIHRLLLKAEFDAVLEELHRLPKFALREVGSLDEMRSMVTDEDAPVNRFGVVSADRVVGVESRSGVVPTVDLEPLVSKFVSEHEGTGVDYIHGDNELLTFAKNPSNVGILLPPFRKTGFFKSIIENGPLPRKSFSMGDADEKRFYLECRQLF
jgi:hypothetical protein